MFLLPGAKIGSVLALDNDSMLNGDTQYSISQVEDSSKFTVDKNTGEISIRNSLHDKVSRNTV